MAGAPARIGIAACSAEGAALCFRTICAEGAERFGRYDHPEIVLHAPPLARYVRCIEADDWSGVAALMLASANVLAAAGADFIVCPDNTIQQALPVIAPMSPLPWLNMADVVADEAAARGYRRIGLLGTRWLIDSGLYPERLAARNIAWIRPNGAQRDNVHRIIMDELVNGVQTGAAVAELQKIVGDLRAVGADAVLLGCTELPLVLSDANAALPTLDTTRLLARAALRRAAEAAV